MTTTARRLIIFRDRHPLIGPVFWLLSVQYFITQYIVGRAWHIPFSLQYNVISDLGNTACGQYSGRFVCSPEHAAMNASFIVLGLTMLLGAIYIPSEFRKRPSARLAFLGMALAGIGTILVGLFPENTIPALHFTGALLPFLIGNVALIIFSYSLDIPPIFRWYTRLSGIAALIGLILFETNTYLGLGQGGMERVVAYPQTVWLIAFGIYMSMNHAKLVRGNRTTYRS